jgi:hypothetical protein
MITFLSSPISSFASPSCELPCIHQNEQWKIQVKEIKSKSSDLSSLWFQLENIDLPKDQVSIAGFIESPILNLKIPLFNTVHLKKLPQNREFIFQQYYEPTNSENIELMLTWRENNQMYSDIIVVNLESNSPIKE